MTMRTWQPGQQLTELTIPHGSRLFLRADLNVPIAHGQIADDLRIERSLPAIRLALERGAKLILASHFGRPKPGPSAEFSLAPVARQLAEVLGRPVPLISANGISGSSPDDWSRSAVAALRSEVEGMTPGKVVLWENLRFHPGEKRNDQAFAASLADFLDIYCHDAFGAAQNRDASLLALPQIMRAQGKPCVAGPLLVTELESLGKLLQSPARPFVVVMGGAKVTDKALTIVHLLERCDELIIGGALAYPFLAAEGIDVGKSKLDRVIDVPLAREILDRAEKLGRRLSLPVDHWTVPIVEQPGGKAFPRLCGPRSLQRGSISNGEAGIDIGPESARRFTEQIGHAATVFWNGPMGLFDKCPLFAFGTRAIAESVAAARGEAIAAQRECFAVVGGGESASAVRQFGLAPEFSFLSTGGGASLRLLAGETFESVRRL